MFSPCCKLKKLVSESVEDAEVIDTLSQKEVDMGRPLFLVETLYIWAPCWNGIPPITVNTFWKYLSAFSEVCIQGNLRSHQVDTR